MEERIAAGARTVRGVIALPTPEVPLFGAELLTMARRLGFRCAQVQLISRWGQTDAKTQKTLRLEEKGE
jgi:hypothetical protein